ncbi:hypothetical protein [Nonomuraea endophytica]|uniref:ABC transporter permease n=1 Tax=Nonomuraea endophytica TaxID=714136 RepID=A0A7W8A5V5_9ACTN|nr:hypothetical protein [Nonomuraea endophytica]MBB5079266.1 hypothetical protein [Nonomuraea endophytica]
MILSIILFLVAPGVFVGLLCGSVFFASEAARLSPVVRLAARDVALGGHRTAAPIAVTMVLTACAIVVTSVAVAQSAQGRAWYVPQARHGALLVKLSNADPAVTRAALQREVPADSVVQRDQTTQDRHFGVDVEGVDLPDVEGVIPPGFIGDKALLRYLTGNAATPYDEGTAVVVTPHDLDVDTVTIRYSLRTDDDGAAARTKSLPATVVKSPDRQVNEVFIPTTVIRVLGLAPEAESLIVDPSRHRTTAAEQERVQRRLTDDAYTFLELGYQAPVA